MAVVSSVVAAKIEEFSHELKKDILSREVEIHTLSDLVQVLNLIIEENKIYS